VTEVYYWEGDPRAEEVLETLERLEIPSEGHLLDAEIPSATPYIQHQGETYWDFTEFLRKLDQMD